MLTYSGENCGPRSHRLPLAGSLVTIEGLPMNPRRMAVVESYGLCDSVKSNGHHWSRGIHTCTVRFLGSGYHMTVAWQYIKEVDWTGFPACGMAHGDYSTYADIPQGKRVPLGHKAQRRIAALKEASQAEKLSAEIRQAA